jgi:hypothetical protein
MGRIREEWLVREMKGKGKKGLRGRGFRREVLECRKRGGGKRN